MKGTIMIRKAIALACAAAALLLTACNTIEGARTDVERGGETLQGAAEKAKKCTRGAARCLSGAAPFFCRE